jgi:predicted RNase H-like nuclease (RuvC/YqgF family)
MFNLSEVIVPSLTAFFAALITWLFGRKKENVEVQGSEITNVQEAIKIWREMATDMKAEVAELKEKIELLTTEVHTLRSENVELRQKLETNQTAKKPTKRKGTEPDNTI